MEDTSRQSQVKSRQLRVRSSARRIEEVGGMRIEEEWK
jgi:hypothetical protein